MKPLHQEENDKIVVGFMGAVGLAMLWIFGWCYASIVATPSGRSLYDDELPNPEFISHDQRPIYGPEDLDAPQDMDAALPGFGYGRKPEPDCQTKILDQLKPLKP